MIKENLACMPKLQIISGGSIRKTDSYFLLNKDWKKWNFGRIDDDVTVTWSRASDLLTRNAWRNALPGAICLNFSVLKIHLPVNGCQFVKTYFYRLKVIQDDLLPAFKRVCFLLVYHKNLCWNYHLCSQRGQLCYLKQAMMCADVICKNATFCTKSSLHVLELSWTITVFWSIFTKL